MKWITYTSRASIATYIHPQLYRFTMAEDEAVTYVYNPALKDKVPEAVQKAVADIKAKIITGELKVSQTYLTEEQK